MRQFSEMDPNEPASWVILGSKNVGGAAIDMVNKPEVAGRLGLEREPRLILGKTGWRQGKEGLGIPVGTMDFDAELMIVATPSTPDHEPMRSLIHEQLRRGGVVVTAEKGSVANPEVHAELKALPGELGEWATVGGGTRMLPKLRLDTQDTANIREIHLATNATLTYVFGQVESGDDVAEVTDAARKLGYAEPNAQGAFEVIEGEAKGDVSKKIAIAWRTIFPNLATLSPQTLLGAPLDRSEVLEALNDASAYRHVVSMFPEEERERAEIVTAGRLGGSPIIEHEGWLIIDGFQRVDRSNHLAYFRGSRGPTAGYRVVLGPSDHSQVDLTVETMGTGAGGPTTANALLDNYVAIREQLQS